jgi:putative transposase
VVEGPEDCGSPRSSDLSRCELGEYSVLAYTLMSNHVHLLLQTEAPLAVITKGIKGVSARKANLILGRTGKYFWHDESFDHWVRDEAEKRKVIQYIEGNPATAGLVKSAEDWPWSSARGKI